MFSASSSEAPGAEPGLQSLATAMAIPCVAHRCNRRLSGFSETIKRDGQQDSDGAGSRQRADILGSRVLQVIA